MSQAKQTKTTTQAAAPKSAKAAPSKIAKVKGPVPNYEKKVEAVATTLSSVPKAGVSLRSAFDRHLDVLSGEVDIEFFIQARKVWVKGADRAAAEVAYKAAIETKAQAIRVQAFDKVVMEAARQLRTEDINMILPPLRKAGIRYHEGRVQVCEGLGTWVDPVVFNQFAYDLVPKALAKQPLAITSDDRSVVNLTEHAMKLADKLSTAMDEHFPEAKASAA